MKKFYIVLTILNVATIAALVWSESFYALRETFFDKKTTDILFKF